MDLLRKEVEKTILKNLHHQFSLAIDGWSKGSTHFVGVFAAYNRPKKKGYSSVLVSFSPMVDEKSFTVHYHYEHLTYVFSVYKKTFENVVAITGDNVATNKRIADRCSVKFVGFASYRLNLAVFVYLERHGPLFERVNTLLGKLKNPKLAGTLREHTSLKPIQRSKTRWLSTMDMLENYIRLKLLLDFVSKDRKLVDMLRKPRENSDLDDLQEKLPTLRSVTVALQGENVDLSDVKALCGVLLSTYAEPEFAEYLHQDAETAHSKSFESAIVKLLPKQEEELIEDEKQELTALLIKDGCPVPEIVDSDEIDFVVKCLNKRRIERAAELKNAKYTDARFFLSTSDLLENFFSSAGFAYGEHRQSLLPVYLEMQLFLNCNQSLWNEETGPKVVN